MAQKTNKEISGTSFHGTSIVCTPKELKNILGEPTYEDNTGEDKVNLEWVCETQNGKVFTIYDWKEYRPIHEDEEIEWHIGGYTGSDTRDAYDELSELLN